MKFGITGKRDTRGDLASDDPSSHRAAHLLFAQSCRCQRTCTAFYSSCYRAGVDGLLDLEVASRGSFDEPPRIRVRSTSSSSAAPGPVKLVVRWGKRSVADGGFRAERTGRRMEHVVTIPAAVAAGGPGGSGVSGGAGTAAAAVSAAAAASAAGAVELDILCTESSAGAAAAPSSAAAASGPSAVAP